MKKSTDRKKEKETIKVHETRKQAFRAAKRDNSIPLGQQPTSVVRPGTPEGRLHGLDHRNRRLYIFRFIVGLFSSTRRRDVHIREDHKAFYGDSGKGDQMEHFNAGEVKLGGKLKQHHYFKRR